MPRLGRLVLLALCAAMLVCAPSARAEIAPPWCGTAEADGVGSLPDGSDPSHPAGSFPHIPYYAIGCTLERIAAQSDGRMTVTVIGQSALGRDMYGVVINALDTAEQRKGFQNWQEVRRIALSDPARAQALVSGAAGAIKVPIFIQAGIHGNESEGVDATMQMIEDLATTPYGEDPRVDRTLDHTVMVFNVVHNPDGRVANTRANGNGFDLNRDYLTQSQSETRASVALMHEWLPPEVLDQHGYVTPTLIEATTKPHNPSIEYDHWLKWNQARIDSNEAAMNDAGYQVTRPINDWCPNGNPPPASGVCAGGIAPGPEVAEGWDDWGPFYTAMFAQHVGLDSSTVEMCSSVTLCGGRAGARDQQSIIAWDTTEFVIAHRSEMLHDMLENYRRGVVNAPRPDCCAAPFGEENDWMLEYPTAYVIPVGAGQRSSVETNRLVEWLLFNQVEVTEVKQDYRYGDQLFEKGSYVVWMSQARRGLADTALRLGVDVSARISRLYAPPAAWSHGYLWGADVVTIERGALDFAPQVNRILRPSHIGGGGFDAGRADRYALEIDGATAVRTVNDLLRAGVAVRQAQGAMTAADGETLAAGSAVFATDAATRNRLAAVGRATGLRFRAVRGPLPELEPIERVPRIAVLTGAVNQDVWTLRNLGFSADPVSTATLNSAADDPLGSYDAVFNTGNWPPASQPLARNRLAAFFSAGGGYLGANVNGAAAFPQAAGLSAGLTATSASGSGRSGIVHWSNEGGAGSILTGTYPAVDTAIMDPPTWFTATGSAGKLAVDGRLPATGFFAAGLWKPADQGTAGGSPVILHGTSDNGVTRMALFAMNPLYRADPEREWPMVGAAAFWADR